MKNRIDLLHDFYDMVQGRENLPITCRCQKVGIGEKSAGHRSIYKACDVGITVEFSSFGSNTT